MSIEVKITNTMKEKLRRQEYVYQIIARTGDKGALTETLIDWLAATHGIHRRTAKDYFKALKVRGEVVEENGRLFLARNLPVIPIETQTILKN